jgi:hypothetical protein
MLDKPDYFRLAREGTLPPDFKDWALADERGWTVAHHAAMAGTLPEGFYRFDLANKAGLTVADVYTGPRPPDYENCKICDERVWTLDDLVDLNRRLPPGFDPWGNVYKDGLTGVDAANVVRTVFHVGKPASRFFFVVMVSNHTVIGPPEGDYRFMMEVRR